MPNILAFDIETIPDVDGGRKLYGLGDLDDTEVAQVMFARQRQLKDTDFLPLHLHRVIVISIAAHEGRGHLPGHRAPVSARFDAGRDDAPSRVLIYPAGFYRRKAEQIREISRRLERQNEGKVPSTIDELLELRGVGRKTANLVVTLGFSKPGICVDVHVHRITNRLGWVRTDHPDRTEEQLRKVLPRRFWIPINEILVRHGQQVCKPQSPICSSCPVASDCPKRGVTRRR